ncbi:SDR family NAD(P)-dependent oxidoreductase [Acidothermaceae bacterium B102]|nr:SDR family NAD(P)-dependent oxidoreductase [Acidothermaceae bacterium B102]
MNGGFGQHRPHDGRIAVVTGAADGLGQAYACRLANDGARVVVADVNDGGRTVELIEAQGGEALSVVCDVTSEEDVDNLRSVTLDRFGACDVLVNNAGISPNTGWRDMTLAAWRRVMSVNLDSMFLTCKAFTPAMMDAGFGRVINISSNTFGLVIPGFAAYTASKGGVIGFTRALASDLGESGITVNAVLPGLTKTGFTESQWAGTTFFDDMAATQAIKRPGLPSDLEAIISFLATEDARWLTGQSFVVDGGLVRH